MYTEVFSLDSKTSHFNRAVDRVKKDPQCLELLGNSKKITAYGEQTWNKWARARPIAYESELLYQNKRLHLFPDRVYERIRLARNISSCTLM